MPKKTGEDLKISKARIAAIHASEARGGYGPFVSIPQPTNDQKLSPLGKVKKIFTVPPMQGLGDRKSQTDELHKQGDM